MSWKQWTVDVPDAHLKNLFESWHWKIPANAQPIVVSAMGDVFFQDSAGAVHFLDTTGGTTKPVADDRSTFDTLLHDPDFQETFLKSPRVTTLEQAGKKRSAGECYSAEHPVFLGGPDTPENFEPCQALVHIAIAGQIHQQIKDLPPGTPINIKLE